MKKINLTLIGIIILASFLRLWGLDRVPVSLFGDELDVGYHAYSILKTGRDYSGNPWPLHFQSFAEWRTPLYLYSAVPTVAIFGITPYGVRLPATIFGILGVWLFYLLVKEVFRETTQSKARNRAESIALVATTVLAISPWHIQYSRAGFEVTQMLVFFLAGIYFFMRGLRDPRLLTFSAIFLALTPWVYSTAKFFLPLTLIALFLIWRRELVKLPRKQLTSAVIAFLVVIVPITWSTIFGGGTARFGHLSIFTDPTTVPEVGFARLVDARMRDEKAEFGIQPNLIDRVVHNKLLSWAEIFGRNYMQSFSTQFLFINGDINLRHSPSGVGQFYKPEFLFLILGSIFFFLMPIDKKIKMFLLFWVLAAPIPAALTRDGGMHATRLFFLLPPLVIFTTTGIFKLFEIVGNRYRSLLVLALFGLYTLSFFFYQHTYWVHYSWQSERWWHAGFKEAIQTARELENNYEKVIITMASEPAWVFFAGWYEYEPDVWHKNFPFSKVDLPGYGEISHIGKFHFGSPALKSGIYSLSEFLTKDTLYVASAKEFNINFIQESERLPQNLKMIKAVPYPSGEPAFYLLTLNPDYQAP